MDLEIVEVETNVAAMAKPGRLETENPDLAGTRRLHSENWIAERVQAALDRELANGRLPS
jgi:hypothetical protein